MRLKPQTCALTAVAYQRRHVEQSGTEGLGGVSAYACSGGLCIADGSTAEDLRRFKECLSRALKRSLNVTLSARTKVRAYLRNKGNRNDNSNRKDKTDLLRDDNKKDRG